MDASPEVQDPREERLNAVLGAYLEAGDAGWAPSSDLLLTRYPDLADDLRAYFDAEARVAALAAPGSLAAPGLNGNYSQREPKTIATLKVRPRSSKPAAPPMSVDDYTSLEVLKEGGMGIVYKAWQKGANRWVALKMIRAGQFAKPAEVRRFRDEAEAVASLDHPNIVPIYDVGEHQGLPFFSMKLFETGSLHQHLERYTRDIAAGVKLLSTVCRAVHYGHQHGILHRDLKPANILLDAEGQPHVTDFGLAKRLFPAAPPARPTGGAGEAAEPTPQSPAPKQGTVVSEAADDAATVDEVPADLVGYMAPEQALKTDEATVSVDHAARGRTAAGTAVGTPGYLAPEHAKIVKADASTASDVYSLGAILYRLLTGQTLFPTSNRGEAIRLAWEGVPDAPRKLNPHADEKLEAICLKCLEREPAKRYASAQALAEDLDRWSQGDWPLAWTPPRRLRVWRRVRQNLLVVTLSALTSFAAAAAFFALYYFDPDRPARHLDAAAGKGPVTLVDETGPPDWMSVLDGAGTIWASEKGDRPFAFATFEQGRIELLRRAPAKQYRFSAEVRHDEVFVSGKVGIFVAHTKIASEEGFQRHWIDFTYADQGGFARGTPGPTQQPNDRPTTHSLAALFLNQYSLPRGYLGHATEARRAFLSAEAQGLCPGWRKLIVEVTLDKVKVFWGTDALREYSRAELRELGQERRVGKNHIPRSEHDLEGGLGLYVNRGKASFRHVVVEPLK